MNLLEIYDEYKGSVYFMCELINLKPRTRLMIVPRSRLLLSITSNLFYDPHFAILLDSCYLLFMLILLLFDSQYRLRIIGTMLLT